MEETTEKLMFDSMKNELESKLRRRLTFEEELEIMSRIPNRVRVPQPKYIIELDPYLYGK